MPIHNNATVVDMLWAQTEPSVFITRDEFVRGLDGWTIEPVEIDGALAFAKLTRGPEFHFASFDAGRPLSMRLGRQWLQPILDEHGHVTTRTPKDAARQHRFNRLVGFVVTGEDEFFVHYRLDKASCQ